MSVHRYETADGTRWRVRWRDAAGKMHSKSLAGKSEALAFDTDIKARKLRSELLPAATSYTLNRAWDDWLAIRRMDLAPSTIASYETLWEAHVRDSALGHTALGALVADPKLVEDHLAGLKSKDPKNARLPVGQRAPLGPGSKRRLVMMLSGLFTECVRWRKVSINPIKGMRRPGSAPEEAARPFSPIVIERIRQQILNLPNPEGNRLRPHGHSCLVALLSYAGLRPQEALALQIRDIGSNVITVDKAVTLTADGSMVGPTKTRRKRSVPLIEPLAEDLSEWLSMRDNPLDGDPVIPSTNGGTWTTSMYRNWRKRVWKPAVAALASSDPNLALLASSRPYDCRSSFVSLHLRAGMPPPDVAKAAGHSPSVMYRHYAEVIDELAGQPQLAAAEQITRARQLLQEEAPQEVAELTAESLKPADKVSPQAAAILYGEFPRISRTRSD